MATKDAHEQAAHAIAPDELRAEWVSDPALVDQLLAAPVGRRLRPVPVLLVLFTCACVVTGAWFAAKLTWRLLDEPPETSAAALASLAPPTTPRRPTVDINRIINAHLFGMPQSTNVDTAPPETRLAIVLQGIIYTDVKQDARAIIARQGDAQNSYRIGQTIGNDAILAEIHQGYVIIERSGEREKLSLRVDGDDRAAARPALPMHRRHDLRGDYQTARVLGRVQARLMTDPGSVMSIMRIVPVTGADGIEGVKVFPGPEPGLFQAFKLQPGDVLTAVNGIPLDSPARGLEVVRNLAAARELEFEVLRGGKRLSYSFSVSQ
jgi:general secretion pathway protein C